MKPQPFDPCVSHTPPDTQPDTPSEPHPDTASPLASGGASPFFDRAGLVWILACVAIAVAAGRWIPRLTEPGAWSGALHATLGFAGWPVMASAAKPQDKAKPEDASAGLNHPFEHTAAPVSQLKQEVF